MGLAISVNYYPLFLLPLWFSFYWHRGLLRFGVGVLLTVLVMVARWSSRRDSFARSSTQVRQMFGWKIDLSTHGRRLLGLRT